MAEIGSVQTDAAQASETLDGAAQAGPQGVGPNETKGSQATADVTDSSAEQSTDIAAAGEIALVTADAEPPEPAPPTGATSFIQRAVLRRRVRYLARRRELALHDLGGFLFESHRLGESRADLLAEKLAATGALDDEIATLQRALDLREELAVLHEPGIASCPQCSTIHDSAANYCPHCGRPAADGRA